MVQSVNLPDGTIGQFPDEMSDDQIKSILRQKFPPPSNNISGQAAPTDYKMMGAPQGADINTLQGFKNSPGVDVLAGLANAIHGISNLGTNTPDKFNPNAYQALGIEDKPLTSSGGMLQALGGLLIPGGIAKEAAPAIAEKAADIGKGAVNAISPTKIGKELLNEIGGGASKESDYAKPVADTIRKLHDMHVAQAGEHLNYPLRQAGKEEIYNASSPLTSTAPDKFEKMINQLKGLDIDIGKPLENFKNEPTFENAHKLQSELGNIQGNLMDPAYKTIESAAQVGRVKNVRSALKNDIFDFLNNRDLNSNETLAPSYKLGSDLYAKEVEPYLSSKSLQKLTRGRENYVPDIHKIFENPDAANTINKATGEMEQSGANKILQELPRDIKDKIFFSALGGMKHARNPEGLLNEATSAINKGYDKIAPEGLDAALADIARKQKTQGIAKVATGIAGYGTLAELLKKFLP